MSRLPILSLLGAAALTAALPADISARAVTTFAAGSSWDIILKGSGEAKNVDAIVKASFSTIDIDLFDTSADSIKKMKANKKVICYFSAGSREDWRPDAADFKPADYKNPVEGGPDGDWEGENWVDVTSTNVRSIMKKRIELAKSKGCDAVDPDNVDGFDNNTGYNNPRSAYVDYVKYMAKVARDNDLAIGLKNALGMIPDVVGDVQFAVNEQCKEHEECEEYKPFTTANKAVFHIEYMKAGDSCTDPAGVNLSTLIKSEDQALDKLGGAC